MRKTGVIGVVLVLGCVAASCANNAATVCSLDGGNNGGCTADKTCEVVRGSMPACFAPVRIEGAVVALPAKTPIAGARVTAIDPNGAPASATVITDAMGKYTMQIPAERNPDGTIASASYTLRAEANGYQNFPNAVRPALPVDTTSPTMTTAGWVIRNGTTDIGLVALATASRGSIEGRVEGSVKGGVLVTAGGATTVSAPDGTFTIFNVPAGSVMVRGFAAGTQLQTVSVNVMAGMTTSNVVLSQLSTPLATISGNVQLVNAGGATTTSVVLVLEETFNATLERGEVPRGLRVGNVSGAFTLRDVPDGAYVVLAAYENDGLVRDPDPGIAGTQIVHVTVPMNGNRAITLADSFKLTGALSVIAPGADKPETITSPNVQFQWVDDSSEDGYELRVFDSLGMLACENLNVPRMTGGNVTATCTGFVPTANTYYQFRATSWRNRNNMHAPISRTEDLRGVFVLSTP